MKYIYTLVLLLSALFHTDIQAQDFSWAKEISGVSSEEPIASVTDAEGNTIIAGIYTSPTLTLGEYTLTNANDNQTFFDIFLIKYNSQGNILWAKSAGSPEHDYPRDVAIDANGNIYLTGYFGDGAIFDNITLTAAENFVAEAFLIKYNADGVIQWTRQTERMQFEGFPTTMDVDPSGNVYLCGNGLFGDLNLFGMEHPDEGDYQGYVLKLDTNGSILWLKEFWYDDNAGSNRNIDLQEITVNSDGSKFNVSGNFWGVFDFGGLIDTSRVFFTNLNQSIDIFTASYNADGDLIWQDSPGGYEWGATNVVTGIGMDESDNLYLAGLLGGKMYFDNGDSIFVNHPDFNDEELFLLKYNSNGQLEWVEQVAAQNNNAGVRPEGMAVSPAGNIFLTGFYEWDPQFGGMEVPIQNHATFFVKYNAAGAVQWINTNQSSLGSEGIDISIDADENVYTSGHFTFSASFGSVSLENGNARGAYLTKLGASPNATGSLESGLQMDIFPNPARAHINLQYLISQGDQQALESGSGFLIQLIDMRGSILKTYPPGYTRQINISDLLAGQYLLRLNTGQQSVVHRFVKL